MVANYKENCLDSFSRVQKTSYFHLQFGVYPSLETCKISVANEAVDVRRGPMLQTGFKDGHEKILTRIRTA